MQSVKQSFINFDRYIILRIPATRDQDGFGEERFVYSDQPLHASVETLLGTENIAASHKDTAYIEIKVIIRYRRIDTLHQILYEGITYDITSVTELGRRQYTLIKAQARQ